MAKAKKKKAEAEIKAEEVMIEEEAKAEEPKEEPKAVADDRQFITAQLKAINRMPNSAKAQRLAERILNNRKG